MDEIFVDGILGAGFSQGAVRIDFHSISNIAQGSKEPRLRLIMTTEGFVEAYAQMTAIMEQLKKTAAARGGAPASAGTADATQAGAGTSDAVTAGAGQAGVGLAGEGQVGAAVSPSGNISPNF